MSITDRSAVSTDPIEQTVQFGRIAAAIEYLYDHAADQPTLAQVSQAVHVSPEYLQRQFQQWAGVSPKKMLQHISLERAKAALAGQQSTLDAAWSSGFSGTGRLHDAFVTIEGMTPGEYKNGGANLRIVWRYAASPFGMVLIAATDKGICHMAFADNPDAALTNLRAEYPNAQLHEGEHPFHEQALKYFRWRRGAHRPAFEGYAVSGAGVACTFEYSAGVRAKLWVCGWEYWPPACRPCRGNRCGA